MFRPEFACLKGSTSHKNKLEVKFSFYDEIEFSVFRIKHMLLCVGVKKIYNVMLKS